MSHLRQSRATLTRDKESRVKVASVTRRVARCVMARRTVARLVFGIERCSFLCDCDARQSRASKTRDKRPMSHLRFCRASKTVTGHLAYETFRLLDTSPTTWTLRLLDVSPTGPFAYETVRLRDTSPMTWTFRLHDISPPIKLLDRRNLWLCPPKFKWLT